MLGDRSDSVTPVCFWPSSRLGALSGTLAVAVSLVHHESNLPGESYTWNTILDLSFHYKAGDILRGHMGLEQGHGDFRDVAIIDVSGAGTLSSGMASVRTTMSGTGLHCQRSLWGRPRSLHNVCPSAPVDEQISDLDDLGLPFSGCGFALLLGR